MYIKATCYQLSLSSPVTIACHLPNMLAALRNLPIYEDLNRGIAFVGFTSSLGALGFGYNNGWWGGALGISEFKRKYGSYNSALDEWSIASENLSVGTGTGSVGLIIGCIIAPIILRNMFARLGSWSYRYSSCLVLC